MLECGKNFGGTMSGICTECNVHDDENHHLNHCKKWKNINLCNATEKTAFELISSDDIETLRNLIKKIQLVWNTKFAYGTMNVE